jgi:hypothetical protein
MKNKLSLIHFAVVAALSLGVINLAKADSAAPLLLLRLPVPR